MEADWDEITRIAVPASGPLAMSNPATAVAFDDSQELLWIGTDHGRVISYHGPELSRYTSVKAHLNEGQVRQLLVHDKGVVSLSFRSVHMISRKGLTQWHVSHPEMTELRCMSLTSNPSHILVAGTQPTLFILDIDKGQIIAQHPAQARYTLMKKSRHICAATDDGMVHVLSLSDYSLLKSWKAHAAAVNDMDARNDFLVTCGFSVRQLGVPLVDPLANVYDLKNLKPLPPIPFHAGAAYIRLHPKLQTTSFVASQTGQMQMVDLMNPVSVVLRQANVQFMLGMEIAPSGNAVVISDTNGLIYMWGSPNKMIRFNSISKETEFGDPQSQAIPHIDWNDTPLNTIGIPYYSERLLSAWPSSMIFDTGAPPVPVNPNVLPYLQAAEVGQYGPNLMRGKLRRYQVEDTRSDQAPVILAAPKFLSDRTRETIKNDDVEPRLSKAAEMLSNLSTNGRAQTDRERMLKYSNVEIRYSRFGVDDFDFRYYNKTDFSGLETHISNSFINSLLQLYKFIPLLRNLAIQHTATACVLPNCLLCELGFLFDMLEKAAGQNCQATNLLRAFSASREAAHLNIFEESAFASPSSLSNTIQAVNRFFLKQITHDYASVGGSVEGIDELFATSAVESIRCMYCGNETTKPGQMYVHDLLYPTIDSKHVLRNPAFKFSNILKATIERETKNRGWCNKCRRYQQLAIRKSVRHVPHVLMINAAILNPAVRALWEVPGWLPTEIGLSLQGRNIYCFEGAELSQARGKSTNLVIYELVGFVSEIDTTDRQQPHLVSMINVDISSTKSQGKNFRNWHLFNDFLVSPVDPREAIHFSKAWKMPCILAYQVKSAHGKIDDTWKNHLDTSLLHQPYSMNGIAAADQCLVLDHEERPAAGTPIALDTEFVELERPEIDVKADGTQETIRPAKSGLARVSVLRGNGENEGRPFVDDYITIYDAIVDYKTQYSGIKPGDLNPRFSTHNLVPLKVSYKKLWLLLNLGCVFVGHGLASDFRKANIHVPEIQTVDTQKLYQAPGKNRRLSLKYLAWAVFNEYIQEDTPDEAAQIEGHDSIEDARMALRLWRKFLEYKDAGVAEQMIDEIYRKGTRWNWKPPPRSGGLTVGDGGWTPAGDNGSAVPSGRNTPDMNFGPGSRVNFTGSPYRLPPTSAGTFTPTGNGVIRESPLSSASTYAREIDHRAEKTERLIPHATEDARSGYHH